MSLKEILSSITSLYYEKQFSEAKALLSKAFELAKEADQASENFKRTLIKLYGVAGDITAQQAIVNKFEENESNMQKALSAMENCMLHKQ